MPSLMAVQRDFRDAVLAAGASVPAVIIGGRVSAEARLAIYRNNVTGAFIRALRLAYPAIVRLVGDDFFEHAARQFIAAVRPTTADLYAYGQGFGEFLEGFPGSESLRYLPDVARLEWAVNRAAHWPDATANCSKALGAIPLNYDANIRYAPHPALTLLRLSHPARHIWEAELIEESDGRAAALAAVDLAAPGEHIAVYRLSGAPTISVLSPIAFAFAQNLAGGATIAEAAVSFAPPEALTLVAEFLSCNFFVGILPTPSR
ncbi:MAG: hypothetical protein GC186_17935 [Rhodobacteraceae bacterium]|nr:hypothetical protein [Paracoccaceae bacterium]